LGGSNAALARMRPGLTTKAEKIWRRRQKYNSAARRYIVGGVGAKGFSAAAEFVGV